MSSITVTFTGNSSSLNAYFCPEIDLDDRYDYSCCLLDFHAYNSIPNVNIQNNKFYFSKNGGKTFEYVTLPIGAFEIDSIIHMLNAALKKENVGIRLNSSKYTMKCIIESDVFIDFRKTDCIGSLMGFNERLLPPGEFESDKLINIQNINNLRIDCDLITGSYHNGSGTHTIYEFDPMVDPGYKINEQPKHLIYLPLVRRRISTLNISILDQDGKFVDFRGENITCRIHIKRDV